MIQTKSTAQRVVPADRPVDFPNDQWGPRQLAAHHFIVNRLKEGQDPQYEMVGNAYGRIRIIYANLPKHFNAKGGSVAGALRPFRKHGILKPEMVNGAATDWWIFQPAENVPSITTTPYDLWHSVDKPSKSGKSNHGIPKGTSKERGARHKKRTQRARPLASGNTKTSTHVLFHIPPDTSDKLKLKILLEQALQEDAHTIVMNTLKECNKIGRTMLEALDSALKPLDHVLSEADSGLADVICELLERLARLTPPKDDSTADAG